MKDFFLGVWNAMPVWGKIISSIVLIGIAIAGSSIGVWKYIDDNPVEEAIEQAIDEETGLNIDLTPSSPETQGT